AYCILRERKANHIGKNVWTAASGDLIDAALKRPCVLGEYAYAFVRGKQIESKGPALAAQLPVTAEQDEPCPDKKTVASNPFRPQEGTAEPFRRPAGPQICAGRFRAGRPLPEWYADRTDDRQSQEQERPFTRWPLSRCDRHSNPDVRAYR